MFLIVSLPEDSQEEIPVAVVKDKALAMEIVSELRKRSTEASKISRPRWSIDDIAAKDAQF